VWHSGDFGRLLGVTFSGPERCGLFPEAHTKALRRTCIPGSRQHLATGSGRSLTSVMHTKRAAPRQFRLLWLIGVAGKVAGRFANDKQQTGPELLRTRHGRNRLGRLFIDLCAKRLVGWAFGRGSQQHADCTDRSFGRKGPTKTLRGYRAVGGVADR